jgi:hypothetical protein
MLQPEKKSFADTIKAKGPLKTEAAAAAPAVSIGTQTYAEADRKRGGRPKKAEAEKGSKNRVVIYLSDDEMTTFQNAAKKFGVAVTGFVKVAAFEKIQSLK